MTSRVQVFKGILWFLVGLGAAVTIVRFVRGLGATTALTDTTPWGLWVGFDVMGGVALAAGGFVVAAIVHIFHREKYEPVARPAILTALLGYAAVAVGLLYDLGLPWHIWHPVIFWNPRSPLFEVAWCVMLYLTVLFLEFSPVFLERTRFQSAYRALLRLQLPLIVLGIALSTLHQSSLGTLLLIMPFRLHPLWYTSLLPEMFFVSAICLGLSMVILESSVTSWLYRRKPETEMLAGLARIATFALGFYVAFRGWDLWRQGKLGLLAEGSFESRLFITEMLLSAVIPLVLFAIPRVRRTQNGIFVAALASVVGFVLDRIAASGLAQVWATRASYFPAWTEFAVSLGIVAAFTLAYLFIQEHFPVEKEIVDELAELRRYQLFELPRFDRQHLIWLGDPGFCARRIFSLLFGVALGIGLALTPWSPLVAKTPVERARGGDVLRVGFPAGTVQFPHRAHIERIGKELGGRERSCGACHHLAKPGDRGTPCSECHADMYLPTRIFDHELHVRRTGGNGGCRECHPPGRPKAAGSAKACQDCHRKDMMAANERVKEFRHAAAPGLRRAAHGICIPCHERAAKRPGAKKPDLYRCATCHRTPVPHGTVILEQAKGEGGNVQFP